MAKTLAASDSEILQAALLGLESQRDKLEAQISHVRSLLGRKQFTRRAASPNRIADFVGEPSKAGRRSLSPDARKRIAAAQKKRWAAFRKEKNKS